tara:strand:- start:20237 stop:20455 length:219 start_codon:yes stop_codon:yes gene_type:complete
MIYIWKTKKGEYKDIRKMGDHHFHNLVLFIWAKKKENPNVFKAFKSTIRKEITRRDLKLDKILIEGYRDLHD